MLWPYQASVVPEAHTSRLRADFNFGLELGHTSSRTFDPLVPLVHSPLPLLWAAAYPPSTPLPT